MLNFINAPYKIGELLAAALRYRTLSIHLQAIPRSRFAIALGQSNLQAIPAERFAITPYQSNLRAIADYASPTGELALMNNQTISGHF